METSYTHTILNPQIGLEFTHDEHQNDSVMFLGFFLYFLKGITNPLLSGCQHHSVYSLDPHEGVVELGVYWLQVFESQRFVQDTLVKWQRETSVDELAVEKSLRDREACGLIILGLHFFFLTNCCAENPFHYTSRTTLTMIFLRSTSQHVTNWLTMAMKRPMNLKYLRWSGLM